MLAGCNPARVPDDELVVLIEEPPQTIDPRFAVSAYDFKLLRLVYAPLVSVDTPDLEPKYELASRVVRESDTSYLVTIRDGARFSDGEPVTASDVAFTYESARREGRLVLRYRDDGLSSIEVVSPSQVRFRLSHPHAPFLTDLDVGILERPAPGHEEDLLPGAGPYAPIRDGFGDGMKWRFAPNPHYFGGAPKDKLTFKLIPDDNSRLLALVGGSGDLTQNTISPLLLPAVAEQPRLRIERGRSSVYTYLGLNCDDPITGDARVRQAIAYAIDRRAIVERKLGGGAVLATGMLPTFHWAYDGDVPRYEHDPARARRLLDEAGFADPDGDGPRPRFTLLFKSSSNRFRVALAEILAAQLAEVGIAVDIRPLDFPTFFADVKAGNYQMFVMQIPEIAEPDLYTVFFGSARIPTHDDPDRGANRVRYRNPELDALLSDGRRALDRDRRRAIYGRVQAILARDVPVVSLWHEDNVAVMGSRVRGFAILPTAQLSSLARTWKDPAR